MGNREKVYDYYFENYQWDKQRLDDNVLTPYSGVVVDTAYDKNSIMHYEIDKELTGIISGSLNDGMAGIFAPPHPKKRTYLLHTPYKKTYRRTLLKWTFQRHAW